MKGCDDVDERDKARLCPICGKLSTPPFRPFCSKRCCDVDLGRWLGGAYAIPLEEGGNDDTSSVEDEREG